MAKKIYSIRNLLGMDLRESYTDKTGARYIKNMLPENGINKKRNGWESLCQMTDGYFTPLKINGIFEYGGYIIVHAGKKLFRCSYDFKLKEQIEKENGVVLNDQRSYGFAHNGLLWLCAGSGLLLYDGNVLKKAYDMSEAYVPTTTVRATAISLGGAGTPYEKPNLFTKKRKNTFYVSKSVKGEHMFFFDSLVDMTKPVSVTVKFRVRRTIDPDDNSTTAYIGIDSDGKEVNTVVTGKYYTASPKDESFLRVIDGFTDSLGNTVVPKFEEDSAIDYNDLGWPIIIKDEKELYVMYNPTAYRDGVDNIEVEYTAMDDDGQGMIDSFTHIAGATADNGNSILILDDGKNSLYYTDPEKSFYYLPCDNCLTLGNDTEGITAVCQMLDNYLGVYKEHSFYRLKILSDSEEKYELAATNDRQGSINGYCACSLDEDNMCFNQNGVFGTDEPSEAYERHSVLYPRSSRIQNELSAYPRSKAENAFSLVNDGKYYLFIDSTVYVACKEQKIYSDTQRFEYEWWVLDNCPVTYASSIGGEIYMGRDDGYITKFSEGYSDITVTPLYSEYADYLFEDQGYCTSVTFNGALGVKDGDVLYLGKHYVFHSTVKYLTSSGKLFINSQHLFDSQGELCLYSQMNIALYKTNGEFLGKGTVVDVDVGQNCIECDGISCDENCSLMMYIERGDNTPYTLVDQGEYFGLSYNGGLATLLDFEISDVHVREQKAVEASLKTNRIILSPDDKRKTLYGIVFYPTKDTQGEVEIGYETFNNSCEKTVTVSGGLDFESFDFEALSFDRSHSGIKVGFFERAFDNIAIKLSSKEDKGMGVLGIDLIYT